MNESMPDPATAVWNDFVAGQLTRADPEPAPEPEQMRPRAPLFNPMQAAGAMFGPPPGDTAAAFRERFIDAVQQGIWQRRTWGRANSGGWRDLNDPTNWA